jgi:hypothetical protein
MQMNSTPQPTKEAMFAEDRSSRPNESQGLPPPIYRIEAVELIDRPAMPPPFADDLPDRIDKRVRVARSWIMGASILMILLFATATVLSVLLALCKRPYSPSSILPLPEKDAQTVTETSYMTRTLLQTTTTSLVDTFTWTQDNFITITVTSFPQATPSSAPATVARSTCDNEPLFIANDFCVMVNSCNSTAADIAPNDCLNFCKPGLGLQICQQNHATQTERESSCCGHCGCDS